MKKALTKAVNNIHYFVDGMRIDGLHDSLSGDVSECEISDAERASGVNIADLVQPC